MQDQGEVPAKAQRLVSLFTEQQICSKQFLYHLFELGIPTDEIKLWITKHNHDFTYTTLLQKVLQQIKLMQDKTPQALAQALRDNRAPPVITTPIVPQKKHFSSNAFQQSHLTVHDRSIQQGRYERRIEDIYRKEQGQEIVWKNEKKLLDLQLQQSEWQEQPRSNIKDSTKNRNSLGFRIQ